LYLFESTIYSVFLNLIQASKTTDLFIMRHEKAVGIDNQMTEVIYNNRLATIPLILSWEGHTQKSQQ